MCCISLLIVAVVQRFTANASYALNVYIFIKHGEKRLKWCVVVPFYVALGYCLLVLDQPPILV